MLCICHNLIYEKCISTQKFHPAFTPLVNSTTTTHTSQWLVGPSPRPKKGRLHEKQLTLSVHALLQPTNWSSQNPKKSGKVPIQLQKTLCSSTREKLVLMLRLIMVSSSDRQVDVRQRLKPMQQDPG